MAGVRWVTERRVLRRASHQSLKVPVFREQSFDTLRQNAPAAPYASGDWDADYRRDDQDERKVAADTAGAVAPTAVREMPRPARTPMEDDSRLGVASPPPSSNTISVKPAPRPWYGSRRRLLPALVGAAVGAIVVCGALLVVRSSGASNEDSTTVTPTAEPTATSSAVPQSVLPPDFIDEQPLPPSEIPPPPPPPEAGPAAPSANTGNYPRRPVSQPSATPTGRPRTPVQISASPQVKPPPDPGHSAPGDAPKRRRGFFG